jgi:hypothetical protein
VRVTSLSIGVIGILAIGLAASYPRLVQAQIEAKHSTIAKQRSAHCFVLEEGKQIQEGYNYAALLDPSKDWTFNGKPTVEGALLAGVNQSVCDWTGVTAEVGPGGVAQNLIATSSDAMVGSLKKRFSTGGIPFHVVAVRSDRFVPDFEKRAAEAKAKADRESKKIKVIK